jgi:hypothetical protein
VDKIIAQEAISAKLNKTKFSEKSDAAQLEIVDSLVSLREQLVDIYGDYVNLWLRSNKYPDLDVNLDRLLQQIAQLQNLITSASAGELQAAEPMEAVWMWYPDEDPTQAASIGTFYFVRSVTIPEKELVLAELIGWGDDTAKLFVNGTHIFTAVFRGAPKQKSIKEYLHPGQNIIAVEATNLIPSSACVVLEIRLTYADGSKEKLTCDDKWRVTKQVIPNCVTTMPSAEDKNWIPVKLLGKGFISPWGVRIDWP